MPTKTIKITLAHNSDREIKTKQQLESLLAKYDLNKWIFTTSIRIEQGEVPLSHPVLILNTLHLGDDFQLLSLFLHEQIHWLVKENKGDAQKAITELKILFPDIPVDEPREGNSMDSVYRHLIVNYLEFNALKHLIDEDEAIKVILNKKQYVELYKIVIQYENKIQKVLEKYGLII